jgi:hypothetical protein
MTNERKPQPSTENPARVDTYPQSQVQPPPSPPRRLVWQDDEATYERGWPKP